MANKTRSKSNQMNVGGILARFITSAIVLAITAFFTPGFEISSFWTLLLAAVVLTIIDYLINTVIGSESNSVSHGIIGFVVSAIILYSTQFFVAGYSISWVSAIIGAIIYGIVASIIPGKQSLQ